MMEEPPDIAAFGRRIMIIGPTNAGKSTLAVAIGQKLGIPARHVDLYRHAPNTDWVQRSDAEFAALHDAAVAEPEWVMDGNYSALMPGRIAAATGIVALDDALWWRYWRYFARTLNRQRAGALEGNRDSIKWEMIHWLWTTRHSAEKYIAMARDTGLPLAVCRDQRQLQALYRAWGLSLPS
jgi:adenylate kinase family enzyme